MDNPLLGQNLNPDLSNLSKPLIGPSNHSNPLIDQTLVRLV